MNKRGPAPGFLLVEGVRFWPLTDLTDGRRQVCWGQATSLNALNLNRYVASQGGYRAPAGSIIGLPDAGSAAGHLQRVLVRVVPATRRLDLQVFVEIPFLPATHL